MTNRFTGAFGERTPYDAFVKSYHSPYTRESTEDRLGSFLDYSGVIGKDLEERCNKFVKIAKADQKWCEAKILDYFDYLWNLVNDKKITSGTAKNYRAVVKRVMEIAKIEGIDWRFIKNQFPPLPRYSKDVAYSISQINKLCEYSDPRIKAIVYVMATSGIRVGAWNFLKNKHVIPVYREGKIICAILIVYDGEPEEYPTLITKETYDELQKWMELRRIGGETLTDESPLIRDLWDLDKDNDARIVNRLTEEGIASLIRRALKKQGLRGKLEEGKQRHNFKMNHGLRKWHDTALRMVREPYQIRNEDINLLTGHKSRDTIDNYYRPYADGENKLDGHLINEYLRAEEFLTIDPRNMKTDKLEVKITTKLENKYEAQNKEIMKKFDEQSRMMEMMKKQIVYNEFENVIEKLTQERRALKQYGSISANEQFEYFMKSDKAKGMSKADLELIKKMIDSNEILPVGLIPPDEDGEGLDIRSLTQYQRKKFESQIKKLEEDDNKMTNEQMKEYEEGLKENIRIARES